MEVTITPFLLLLLLLLVAGGIRPQVKLISGFPSFVIDLVVLWTIVESKQS